MNLTSSEIKFNERYWSVSFDEQYIYVHQEGKGVKKLAKLENLSEKVGYLLNENSELGNAKCKILYLNGKILL